MSKKKIVIIWSSVSITLIICVYMAVQLITQTLFGVLAPQYLKYGQKIGPAIYHSDNMTEGDRNPIPGSLKIRALLSDTVVSYSLEEYEGESIIDKLMGDYKSTYVYMFLCDDAEPSSIASGSWSNIFRNDPSKVEEDRIGIMELETSFAMFDIEKAVKQGYGQEIITAIKEDEDICVRVDKFALKGLELIPMHVTVLKNDNIINEYTPNTENDIPDGFEIIQEDEVWMYNRSLQGLGSELTNIDLSDLKEIERLRGIAKKTADELDFKDPVLNMENDYYQKRIPFSSTFVSYSVGPAAEGDSLYSLVLVHSMKNTNLFLALGAVTIVGWTVLFAIIVFAFRKRKKKY